MRENIQLFTKRDINRLCYEMTTKGYAVFPGFLLETQRLNLRQLTEDALRRYQPRPVSKRSQLEKDHIHDLLCNNIRFGRLLEDARLQQLLEPFLGPSFIMYAFTSSSIPPGECNYSARIHVDSPRFQANYITNVGVIWTLDDYLIHNGCLRVLPGSHHSPELPPESYFEQHCQPILCPAGSLILFNARLVHRTGRNESPSWRHSLTMNCCRCFMKQRMDWVRFVPESISGQLNEQARRMLGFDTRLPTTLNELFLPDDQRLYKGGQE